MTEKEAIEIGTLCIQARWPTIGQTQLDDAVRAIMPYGGKKVREALPAVAAKDSKFFQLSDLLAELGDKGAIEAKYQRRLDEQSEQSRRAREYAEELDFWWKKAEDHFATIEPDEIARLWDAFIAGKPPGVMLLYNRLVAKKRVPKEFIGSIYEKAEAPPKEPKHDRGTEAAASHAGAGVGAGGPAD